MGRKAIVGVFAFILFAFAVRYGAQLGSRAPAYIPNPPAVHSQQQNFSGNSDSSAPIEGAYRRPSGSRVETNSGMSFVLWAFIVVIIIAGLMSVLNGMRSGRHQEYHTGDRETLTSKGKQM
jgi:hypothetical protein